METSPAKNKMMTAAPVEKAGFHFPGDGVYHNAFIWAANIDEATKEYLATRSLINAPSATQLLVKEEAKPE